MSDYISREAAIVDFERCNHKNPVWTPQRVKTLLMRIPAADVESVRRWIPCSNGRWGGEVAQGRDAKVFYWMPLPEPPKEGAST